MDDALATKLDMLSAEAKGVARRARVVTQLVAQVREEIENGSTAKEAQEHDGRSED